MNLLSFFHSFGAMKVSTRSSFTTESQVSTFVDKCLLRLPHYVMLAEGSSA